MKKIVVLTMVVMFLLSFSACEKDGKTEKAEETAKTETVSEVQTADITSLDVDENLATQYYAVIDTLILSQIRNVMMSYNFIQVREELTQDDLKFYMADLTGDGEDELVVSDSELMYFVYTMEKGHPKCIYNEILIGNRQPDIPCVVKYKNNYYSTRFYSDDYIPGVELSKHANEELVTVVSAMAVLNDSNEIDGYEIDGKSVSAEEYERFVESLEKVGYYSVSQLKQKAKAEKPVKNEKINYEKVYKNFLETYKEKIGVRSGNMSPVIKVDTFDASQYRAEEGFVTHVIKDFNSDGVEDLITIQEVETETNGMAMSESASTLYIKAYTVADEKIICLDSYWIGGEFSVPVLPTYSYVDITCKENLLMISNIGVWCAGGSENEHYIFSLDKNRFTVEHIDFAGDCDVNYEKIEKLKRYGIDYLKGGGDKNAQRLALYSLFGNDGNCSDYFDGTVNEPAGFYNYNK